MYFFFNEKNTINEYIGLKIYLLLLNNLCYKALVDP